MVWYRSLHPNNKGECPNMPLSISFKLCSYHCFPFARACVAGIFSPYFQILSLATITAHTIIILLYGLKSFLIFQKEQY